MPRLQNFARLHGVTYKTVIIIVTVIITSILILEDGTDRLSRNVGEEQSTLCNMPEDRRALDFVCYDALEDG